MDPARSRRRAGILFFPCRASGKVYIIMIVMEHSQVDGLFSESRPHRWVIVFFENGARFKLDPRPPEEVGLWTWTCSACGFTEQTISQLAPPVGAPECPGRAAGGSLSDRFRSLMGSRQVPAESVERFENLLRWMDLYQREKFQVPLHWIAEVLGIMADDSRRLDGSANTHCRVCDAVANDEYCPLCGAPVRNQNNEGRAKQLAACRCGAMGSSKFCESCGAPRDAADSRPA